MQQHHHHAQASTAAGASGHCGNKVPAAQQRRFDVMLKRPENRVCFDCGQRQPRWASTNLGVFFCLRCAGIHRSLGVHISKVKSTNMDAWEESMIAFIEHVGNARGRVLYEYNMSETSKPRPSTESGIVERILRAKYEKKTYYNPRFTELLAEFMQTAITEGDDAAGTVRADAASRQNDAAEQRVLQPPPPAVPPPPAPAPVEELWGAPVSAPAQTPPPPAPRAPTVHDQVNDLFAAPVAAGSSAYPRSTNPFWGSAPPHNAAQNYPQQQQQQHQQQQQQQQQQQHQQQQQQQHQHQQQPVSGDFYYSGGSVSPSSGAAKPGAGKPINTHQVHGQDVRLTEPHGSPLADADNGSVAGASARGPNLAASPASSHATTPQSSRADTEDLFVSPVSQSRAESSSKDEILSLFSSAPAVGSGGGYAQTPPSNPNAAWQPQVIRPYYYPEK